MTRSADLGTRELGAGFGDLFDTVAVDELVSRRGLRTPFLRMAKDGQVLKAERYTRPGGAGAGIADQVADDRVLTQLADGATLVLQALHRTWPPLVEFGSDLAAELGHPVQVNAYITPSQNQGFAAHYDTHDVFVMQVSGRKRWRIHEPVFPDPLNDQPWEQRKDDVQQQAATEPLIDTVLEPGDCLYLPRGYLHAATALGEITTHLTVGVHPVTRANLVAHLLAGSRAQQALRSSLPMGVDLSDPGVLAPHLEATVRALADWLHTADPAAVAQLLDVELNRQLRPEPISPLAQLHAAETLTENSPMMLRAGLRVRTSETGDGLRLQLIDSALTVPIQTRDAMKVVLTGSVFTPAELPGIDREQQLGLVRQLLRAAVVVSV